MGEGAPDAQPTVQRTAQPKAQPKATPAAPVAHARWHKRARHALQHSLRVRLILMFVLLALAVSATFIYGMQKALSTGWRDAARPLVSDYVDRVVAEIGSPPSLQRAQALVQRLPLSVAISGPQVNWRSDAEHDLFRDHPRRFWSDSGSGRWGSDAAEPRLLSRTTADGHLIELGLSLAVLHNQPRRVGWYTLAALLALTALAYAHVRRLLRPLDHIRAGAQRFGAGDFSEPIPIDQRHNRRELEQLAATINTMGRDIHQMLEAKRALLLAISHELRSPLTRARLNTELLPETESLQPQRDALLRDLAEMRDLVTDLLESERLGQGHRALHLEPTDLGTLAREVAASLSLGLQRATHGPTPWAPTATEAHDTDQRPGQSGSAAKVPPTPTRVVLDIATDLPTLPLDRTRMRLLLRNLLDNALRHSAEAEHPPLLSLRTEGRGVCITVRDYGPGVDEAALPHLAEPFYRPDASRERATGGVGLGLHLCKLVALAHGGRLEVGNAGPGLEVRVVISSD